MALVGRFLLCPLRVRQPDKRQGAKKSSRSEIEHNLAQWATRPSGCAIAFHIRYTTRAFLFQTRPARADLYSQKGLVMRIDRQFGFHVVTG